MLLLILGFDASKGRRHAVLPHFFGGQLPSRNLQTPQLASQVLEVAARVQERAESHVAADARKAVKIRQFHGSTSQSWQSRDTAFRPARNVSDGSISILSAAPRGVKSLQYCLPFVQL